MFKRIVAALDGSACSEHAFELALGLAKAEGARLEICSVVDPIGILGRTPPSPLEEEHVAAAKAVADRIVSDAVEKAAALGIEAKGRVLLGEPALKIVGYATKAGADSIVMGTHGRSGFKRFFMGSVAEAVLRSSPCPVVIIREKVPAQSVQAAASLPINPGGQAFVVRLLEVTPEDFERLYGEIATFMQGAGSELPGCVEMQLFGSEDSRRIVIVAQFRSHADWSKAQWDARLGEMLEEIAGSSETLDFNLYCGDRFPGTISTSALLMQHV